MGGMPDPRTRSASAEAPGAVRGQRHEKALGDPCIPFAAAGRALGLRELGRWLFAYAVFLFEAAGEVDQAVRRSACWRSGIRISIELLGLHRHRTPVGRLSHGGA